VDSMDELWSPHEEAALRKQFSYSVVGDKEQVSDKLQSIVEETRADELIIASQVFDHQARLRSYEIIAGITPELR
jgi:alkanesulfonate monooxygenase SsuD/methylene tetrahydromethanopterin reductase-like flavin-dependent oxidoreductase (luciferase family)